MRATPQPVVTCEGFRRLDAEYGTDPRSPLHHDNRCTEEH